MCYPHGYDPSQLCDTFCGVVCDTSLCMSVMMSRVVYIYDSQHTCISVRKSVAKPNPLSATHTTALQVSEKLYYRFFSYIAIYVLAEIGKN